MLVAGDVNGDTVVAKALSKLWLVGWAAILQGKVPEHNARFVPRQCLVQCAVVDVLGVNADETIAPNIPRPLQRADVRLECVWGIVWSQERTPGNSGVGIHQLCVLSALFWGSVFGAVSSINEYIRLLCQRADYQGEALRFQPSKANLRIGDVSDDQGRQCGSWAWR